MPASMTDRSSNPDGNATEFPPPPIDGRVVACLDASGRADKVIPHAAAIAQALHVPLTLLRVLEVAPKAGIPSDPVEWDLRRREAHDHMTRLASERGDESLRIDTTVVEGRPAEQIALWARNHRAVLIAVGTHGDGRAAGWALGDTARKLVDKVSGTLLLVPSSVPDVRVVRYRRLLVPLDGSCQAESVLPLATRLAEADEAELLLTHVVPVPELTEIGPLEAEDIQLREQVTRRNERVARRYLDRIRARIAEQGISVSVILRDGDVRSGLASLAVDEDADLVVLSAHGRGGRADVSCGSVASYLVTHVPTPLLLVLRQSQPKDDNVGPADNPNGRSPGRTTL